MGVCTKERKGVAAEVLMATPCTNSLGGDSDKGHKHELRKDVGGAGFAESSPPFDREEGRVGFIENTARRHRRGG